MATLLGRLRLDKEGYPHFLESLLSVGEGAGPGPSASLRGLACVCALGVHLVTLAQRFQALQKGLPGLRHTLLQQPALTLALGVFGVGHAFQGCVQVAQPRRDGHLWGRGDSEIWAKQQWAWLPGGHGSPWSVVTGTFQ